MAKRIVSWRKLMHVRGLIALLTALLFTLSLSASQPTGVAGVQPLFMSWWSCSGSPWCQTCGYKNFQQECNNCIRCYQSGEATWCDTYSTVRCGSCKHMC